MAGFLCSVAFFVRLIRTNSDHKIGDLRMVTELRGNAPWIMNHDRHSTTVHSLAELERNLQQVRQRTLIATRKGDFHAVARLTKEAKRLNEQISSIRHLEQTVNVSSR